MKQHNLLLHWSMHVLSSDESILASDFVLKQYTLFWSIKANIDLIKKLKLYNSIIALLIYFCIAVVHLLGSHLPVYWPTKERY